MSNLVGARGRRRRRKLAPMPRTSWCTCQTQNPKTLGNSTPRPSNHKAMGFVGPVPENFSKLTLTFLISLGTFYALCMHVKCWSSCLEGVWKLQEAQLLVIGFRFCIKRETDVTIWVVRYLRELRWKTWFGRRQVLFHLGGLHVLQVSCFLWTELWRINENKWE